MAIVSRLLQLHSDAQLPLGEKEQAWRLRQLGSCLALLVLMFSDFVSSLNEV